jgi:hypothetical protein
MANYGITKTGFEIKTFQVILEDKIERARQVFGNDIDVRSTSTLRKLLDISSYEDHELWKRVEQLYYSNFISTASGLSLGLLGEDIGVKRRYRHATGEVKFELSGEQPGRIYHLPIGVLMETDPPERRFRTLKRVSLSDQKKVAVVEITATMRGPAGNVDAGDIKRITPFYAHHRLNLGSAAVDVTNEEPTTGGKEREDDTSYRDHLLGYPRTLWTLESVRNAVKNVDGVRDCRVFDPLGGVDVSLSRFNYFRFSQRRFGTQRLLGTPYYFDILVATYPGIPWESEDGNVGVRENIEKSIQEVRPISIFPNLLRANNVVIGLRAKVFTKPGHDADAVTASINDKLDRRIMALSLDGDVLYSDVLCDCKGVSGVVDVQGLHLRRCPPLFERISFGGRQRFRSQIIEAAVGENISLLPNEIAVFKVDSELIDVEVKDR